MSILTPGANASVPSQLNAVVVLRPVAGVDVDVSAFLLKGDGKVRGDEDMIFYGQPAGAGGKVSFVGSADGRSEFRLDLATLDGTVEKIALTATIHENKARFGSYADIELDLGGVKATVPTAGKAETALILGEFYRRNGEWKFRCLGQGFEGGLAPLATNFGVVVEEPAPAPAAPPAPARISLEKKIEAKAPQLISLAKKVQVTLEKKKLTDVVAQVALVLDGSGSMNGQYSKGRVQELLNRVVPLAVHFDKNEELECWAFAEKPQQLTSVTLDNFNGFIDRDNGGWRKWNLASRINDEPAVIRKVIDFYKKSGDRTPVYALFISDGGIHANAAITALMKEAASLPIFWQFVGIGGSRYGILEKLDTMPNRRVDNCGFFAIDDLHSITEEQLYDRLMDEFPSWLKAARAAGIID
jgi:stress response protein SCP2